MINVCLNFGWPLNRAVGVRTIEKPSLGGPKVAAAA